ncbi:lytic transglycosylase domain-containing protein [Paenibacillus cymbidii]|uniref:lytic transglycosylase domain-containing protein n=1 Tax=Paenibacillus cymbidii TaxID=1639034 RepID=UPI001A9BF1C9|nr:lytic transglycosylase domain-containing protein [Paenibacillus cymbidii]
MSIDPRILQQLLQMQFRSKIDLLSKVANNQPGSDSTFADLLGVLLGGDSETDDADAAISASMSNTSLATMMALRSYSAYAGSSGGDASAYDALIDRAAARNGVDDSLIKAVINAESSFQSNAVSSAGAKGLMQLMDGTAASLGVLNSFDPEQNVNGGTRYLSDLLRKYKGNEAVALAAYNAGSNRIDRLGIATDEQLNAKLDSLPQETRNYVAKVQALKNRYETELP